MFFKTNRSGEHDSSNSGTCPEMQELDPHGAKAHDMGFQIVSANFFQFIGKSVVSLVMTLLRQIILLIPLYFILPHFLGIQGIWLASPISDCASILITIAVISRELLWLNQKIKEQKIHYVNEG